MKSDLGRDVYGLAAIGLAICALIWQSFNVWQVPLSGIPHPKIFIDCIAILEIGGGVAIQFPRSARAGAAVLGTLYAIFALLWLPLWVRNPLVYDRLGAFFEQFSMASGALIVYGPKTARIGYYGFGASLISFGLSQAIHLQATAGLVPKWIPPGQMFWAVVTTIAFALAAIALLTGRSALLAARLTTLMIMLFGVLIWVPATFADPHSLANWAEMGETFAICGAAWILADYLARLPSRR
jgi:uncharacterized membrane protein YphA (DoxX/SURF4 family)